MKTLLTIVSLVTMPLVVSGQGEHDLRLRLCIDGRVHDRWTSLRASEDGVVICATIGDDKSSSRVVTIIGDVLDTFSISGRQLTQGVLVDSLIFFCVYRSDSSVAEYDHRSKEMQFYHHDGSGSGYLPMLISSFGSSLVAYDQFQGPMIVNRERRSLETVFSNWDAYTANDLLGIGDSLILWLYEKPCG